MVSYLPDEDFRSHRLKLDSTDFALTSGEDPLPTDLIPEESWRGLMALPDDVAIRTTSHQGSKAPRLQGSKAPRLQGSKVSILHELWESWIEALPPHSKISNVMLDATDDFSAATFNLLHGYYKQAAASLRNVVEIVSLAFLTDVSGDTALWSKWEAGEEVTFGEIIKDIQNMPSIKSLDDQADKIFGVRLIIGERKSGKIWLRSLYDRLSKYCHSRSNTSNGHFWESNGPIYSPEGMQLAFYSSVETYAVSTILLKIASPSIKFPNKSNYIFNAENTNIYLETPYDKLCTWYHANVNRS